VSFDIKPPAAAKGESVANISNVRIEIVKGVISGYKIIPVEQPKISAGKYQQTFRLDGKLPIPRGTGGNIEVKAKATAIFSNGDVSDGSSKNCKYNVRF